MESFFGGKNGANGSGESMDRGLGGVFKGAPRWNVDAAKQFMDIPKKVEFDESPFDAKTVDVEKIFAEKARGDVERMIPPSALFFDDAVEEWTQRLKVLYQKFADEEGVSVEYLLKNEKETFSL